MTVNLKQRYREEVFEVLHQTLKCNAMQTPKLLKITLNMGLGSAAITDKKQIAGAQKDLKMIAGQHPIVTRTRRSIAGFKIREDWPIGVKVTLRGDRMWHFLQRLIFVVLPRVRDFRGLNSRSFDGHGNYNLGLSEHIVFPEIDYDKVERVRGLDIAITTTARTNEEAYALLSRLFFPFKSKLVKQEG
jgi:large subunit ribosomal protein L5